MKRNWSIIFTFVLITLVWHHNLIVTNDWQLAVKCPWLNLLTTPSCDVTGSWFTYSTVGRGEESNLSSRLNHWFDIEDTNCPGAVTKLSNKQCAYFSVYYNNGSKIFSKRGSNDAQVCRGQWDRSAVFTIVHEHYINTSCSQPCNVFAAYFLPSHRSWTILASSFAVTIPFLKSLFLSLITHYLTSLVIYLLPEATH